MSTSHSAVASALGYLYQCRYALYLLVQRAKTEPTAEISIERFDDISWDVGGMPLQAIQTKHHVGRSGDLTDASHDLWRTIRAWCDGIQTGALRVPECSLALVTTATAPRNSAASLLRMNPRDPDKALGLLLATAKNSRSDSNAAGYAAFLGLSDTLRRDVVHSMFVFDAEPEIVDLLVRIEEELVWAVHRSVLSTLVEHLEGWWIQRVVGQLGGSMVMPIRGDELEAKIRDLQQSFKRDSLPTDLCFVDPPDLPDPKADRRLFVAQLRLLNSSDITISKAICDHYRGFQQRSYWIREHLLLLDELGRYDARLKDEWERRLAAELEDVGEDQCAERLVQAGKNVYRWSQQWNMPIREQCTEPAISRGSYQILADNRQVWWHPNAMQLLEGDTKDGAVVATTP